MTTFVIIFSLMMMIRALECLHFMCLYNLCLIHLDFGILELLLVVLNMS